jgi:hypothetical protein
MWLSTGPSGGTCKHGDILLVSIKCGECWMVKMMEIRSKKITEKEMG